MPQSGFSFWLTILLMLAWFYIADRLLSGFLLLMHGTEARVKLHYIKSGSDSLTECWNMSEVKPTCG